MSLRRQRAVLDAVRTTFDAFPDGPDGGWVPVADLLGDDPTPAERESVNRAVRTLAEAGAVEVGRHWRVGRRVVRLSIPAAIDDVKARHADIVEVARGIHASGGLAVELVRQRAHRRAGGRGPRRQVRLTRALPR